MITVDEAINHKVQTHPSKSDHPPLFKGIVFSRLMLFIFSQSIPLILHLSAGLGFASWCMFCPKQESIDTKAGMVESKRICNNGRGGDHQSDKACHSLLKDPKNDNRLIFLLFRFNSLFSHLRVIATHPLPYFRQCNNLCISINL